MAQLNLIILTSEFIVIFRQTEIILHKNKFPQYFTTLSKTDAKSKFQRNLCSLNKKTLLLADSKLPFIFDVMSRFNVIPERQDSLACL